MKHKLRSAQSTEGRRMAGARALWVANGMKREQFGKPIVAIVNSFTQFVPGHTHLHEIGQMVKAEIEKMGCYAAEFNTIAIDDGIAMGHDGMLYSLPSRDIIADSVEYMVNAHKADAMICISNCDKITPGMLMASMRLNIPTVFVSGGPMEAHKINGENADLITAMIKGADTSVSDEEMAKIEACACPGCGSCSGMFTANSMNSLTEAIDAIDEDDFCRVPAHFDTLPNLSLDYSILEKSENVYVQVCDFGWADLGSWCSLHNDTQHDRQDNVLLNTEALLYNSEGNVICLPKGRIAVIDGLKGFVVAEKGDVLMICPKDDSAALRRMMTDAQMKLGEEFI